MSALPFRLLPLAGLLLVGATALAQERPPRRPGPPRGQGQPYSLAQATSDEAQLHTIAFSGLAWITGDLGSATFIPPGKVSDFFGFQYMRDIDAAGRGHNPLFLDRVAGNVCAILTDAQKRSFQETAREQAPLFEAIARKRIPLIAAFHRELTGTPPAGRGRLSRAAVETYCADLFVLDATLAYRRARLFGEVARALTPEQKARLGRMTFGDFNTWPEIDPESFRRDRPRGASKLESVGYMTLASEFFSWVAGSVEADTYFCPERHGTYFGGFYLKDLPAMGQRDFNISTALTGDSGRAFLEALTPAQRQRFDALLERQRKPLAEIVEVRRAIAVKLRGFLKGEAPTEAEVLALGRRYGVCDGTLAYEYATVFAETKASLSPEQRARIQALRGQPAREEGSAFLYSDRIPMPALPDLASFFLPRPGGRS